MPREDLTGEDWENKFIPKVLGGLDLDDKADSMGDGTFFSLGNMIYWDGELRKDSGFVTFADVPLGTPRKTIQHITAGGSANTFLITNTSFYRLNGAGTGWLLVQLNGGGQTTLTANASGGATTITVASIANFADTDVIAIRLDTGLDHVTTINGTPAGSTITLTDAIPGSGVVATSGNSVIEGVKLSGTNDEYVDALTIPWNDALVFTNGIDNVMYYDPATAQVQDVPNLPSSGNTQCKALVLFDSSLILVATVEGGSNFHQRTRWCDKADFTNWTTGDAGFIDHLDSAEKVLTARKLGPHLAVYRENSIVRGTIIGTSTKRFQWDTMVTSRGLISRAAIADIGDTHFCVGQEDIYIYRGGFDTTPIGANVENLLFGDDAELDEANVHRLFTVYIRERKDVWIFYQTTAGTLPDKSIRYSIKYNAYTTRSWDAQYLGSGESVDANTFSWNDLIGSWETQTWKWSSTSIVGNSRTVLLCRDDGQVVEYNFIAPDDAGVAQNWEIETPDIVHPNGVLRHDYVELRCSGGQTTIEYSTDAGINWITIEVFTPGTDPVKVRIYKQFTGERIRYRLTGSSSFKLHWYNIRYTVETEY